MTALSQTSDNADLGPPRQGEGSRSGQVSGREFMLMAFADPLRFAMATIHSGVDYANSNGLAIFDGAGSRWPADGLPARQAALPSQLFGFARRYEVARYG